VSAAAPSPCAITESRAIGGVRISMDVKAALTLTGPPLMQRVQGQQIIYALRPPWSQMTAEYGRVQRISTRSPACRTATGIGPGSPAEAVRAAYAAAAASVATAVHDGELVSFPFNGVALLIRGGRVDTVEVFEAESLAASGRPVGPRTAGAPAPRATPVPAPAAWMIRGLTARVEGTTLIVTGSVENRGRPLSVYVEITALDLRGQAAGTADGAVDPVPVPVGGTGRFEARIVLDDVVRRYTVVLRPTGAITGALAEQAGELRGLQQFTPVVLKKLQVTVTPLANPARLVIEVRNGSTVAVSGVTVAVEATTRCFLSYPRPSPIPGGNIYGRFIVDTVTRLVAVPPIAPGGSAQATATLAARLEGCVDLLVLSAKARVVDVRIAD